MSSSRPRDHHDDDDDGMQGQLSQQVWQSLSCIYWALYFIGWTINRWRGGNRSIQRKPLKTCFRKCHILQPKASSPKRDSNLHNSIGGRPGKVTVTPHVATHAYHQVRGWNLSLSIVFCALCGIPKILHTSNLFLMFKYMFSSVHAIQNLSIVKLNFTQTYVREMHKQTKTGK